MPNRIEQRHTVSSAESNGDETACPVPIPAPRQPLSYSTGIPGLGGVWGRFAQFGFAGLAASMLVAFAWWNRIDMQEQRAYDRNERKAEKLDERERMKERDDSHNKILQSLSKSIDNQAKATDSLKVETRDTRTAVEELTKTIKGMK